MYAWSGVLLKGMGERFLLSKNEPLTPDIDGVMALWIFRRRAQNMKIGQKLAKFWPLDPSFNFSDPSLSKKSFGVFYWGLREQAVILKIPVQNRPQKRGENKLPHLVQAISPYKFNFVHFEEQILPFLVLEGQASTKRHAERSFLWC